jgi:hypothetical protein
MIWATIPGRALAALVFWGYGGVWKNVAIFEALCGGLVAGAMGWEALRERKRKED